MPRSRELVARNAYVRDKKWVTGLLQSIFYLCSIRLRNSHKPAVKGIVRRAKNGEFMRKGGKNRDKLRCDCVLLCGNYPRRAVSCQRFRAGGKGTLRIQKIPAQKTHGRRKFSALQPR